MQQLRPLHTLDHPPPAELRRGAFARSPLAAPVLVVGGLTVSLLWAYWPVLTMMAERWSRDAQYSHGFLVPVFALVILWFRRPLCPKELPQGSAWGVALLGAAVLLRGVAAYLFLDPLDSLSLLPFVAGLILFLGGWPTLRWAWPAVAFLAFMLPLPYAIEISMAQPLRSLGTVASTYALQVLGFPAVAEGNVILIDDLKLGVIDACNGLGMLMTFFALATAFALVIQRPLLDRLLLVASAIPIALIANVVRITVTAMAHRTLGSAVANTIMHDLAGWLMMPLALLMLWGELRYLDCLLVEVPPARPLPLMIPQGPPALTYVRKDNDAKPPSAPWLPPVGSVEPAAPGRR